MLLVLWQLTDLAMPADIAILNSQLNCDVLRLRSTSDIRKASRFLAVPDMIGKLWTAHTGSREDMALQE